MNLSRLVENVVAGATRGANQSTRSMELEGVEDSQNANRTNVVIPVITIITGQIRIERDLEMES